jgi:hypothetical protein
VLHDPGDLIPLLRAIADAVTDDEDSRTFTRYVGDDCERRSKNVARVGRKT